MPSYYSNSNKAHPPKYGPPKQPPAHYPRPPAPFPPSPPYTPPGQQGPVQYNNQFNGYPQQPYAQQPAISYGMPPQMMQYNAGPPPAPAFGGFGGDAHYAHMPGSVVKIGPKAIAKDAMRFAMNQEVEVCIRGNRWILGIIVGIAEWVHNLTAKKYRVRYSIDNRRDLEEEFDDRHMRPL